MLRRTSASIIKHALGTSLILTHSTHGYHRDAGLSLSNGKNLQFRSSKLVTTPSSESTLTSYSSFCTSASKSTPPPNLHNKLLRKIKSNILSSGPMTVAEYMRLVLTHNKHGYYMQNDVFGAKGDFTTSPEISQMFGELVGVWCVNEWMQCGKPSPFNVVEFGPGRGTLADDMLRVFKKFPEFSKAIDLHFIEVSPKLREMQQNKLCVSNDRVSEASSDRSNPSNPPAPTEDALVTKTGVKLHWWNDISELPEGPTFYVAHEFFDALPIHKFQKVNGKWREVLVDYHEDQLRFVLSSSDTVATAMLKDHLNNHPTDHLEVSPQSLQIVREIATRIQKNEGYALIIDYGHLGDKGDTFRAFSKHHLVEPLENPGLVDLTADVNFDLLKSQCLDKVSVFGPTPQADFLGLMGIALRLRVLLHSATEEQRKDLISGYDMLTNMDNMGERFKFMALMSCKSLPKDYRPAGFEISIGSD